MSMIDAIPLLAGAGADGGYQISRSVRLRSSATAYFTRTPSVAGNQKTFTLSMWVKRGALTGDNTMFAVRAVSTSTPYWYITFDTSTNILSLNSNAGGALYTTQLFRDPAAWYHILYAVDTTQATASNRTKLYINGLQVTTFTTATYPALNADTGVNSTTQSWVGCGTNGAGTIMQYFDGYMTEINLIDGQQLTPSSFGETNALTGVWQPKRYAGTYGTNGFYLNFSDNSGVTATTIGKDYSGNGNNWTPNNISITAGVTYDSMLDVPTLWADGGNGRGNYPVWNPLTSGGLVTFTEANLKALSTSASVPYNIESTIKTATTGKWYAEVTMAVGASSPAVGIGNNPSASSSNTDQFTAYRVNGTYITSGMGASSTGTPATFTTNDVIGIAYDVGAGTLSFYKNGTLQTGGFTGITAGNYSFIVRKDSASGDGGYLNCGQRPFTYTPPTGFVALNTQNLPTPTISKGNQYMDVVLYTGNAVQDRAITGFGFDLDLAWIKSRNNAGSHVLVNNVVGGDKQLFSNLTNAEQTNSDMTNGFTTGGILVGDNITGTGSTNQNTYTYALWGWNAGGSTVTNTSGTISAQVRANPTAGFSVVTYTGTGANATVGHGLNATPAMIIVKNRDSGAIGGAVYHTSLGATKYLKLFQTTTGSDNEATDNTAWNGGSPTFNSSVFSVGSLNRTNSSQQMVAYCFAAVSGYSAFGKYTGNGNSTDGPFVYCGFRPRFVMVKSSTVVVNWLVYDTARDAYNVMNAELFPSTSGAEVTASTNDFDFLSNGFKCRRGGTISNQSGETYIYMAFAENPFKNSLAR